MDGSEVTSDVLSPRAAGWRRASAMAPDAGSGVTASDVAVVPAPRVRGAAVRRLEGAPAFVEGGVRAFLAPSAVPRGCAPESTDVGFRAHVGLLRRLTLDVFDINRWLFVYRPLARVNAVLEVALLGVVEEGKGGWGVGGVLRSAAVYVAGNACGSVYVAALACEMKSVMKARPAAEGCLPEAVLHGAGLTEREVAALDFAQEVVGLGSAVSEGTRRAMLDADADNDGKIERHVAGVAAYGAFLSRLTGAIDAELTYDAVQYASHNLQGLPWKPSGGHFRIEAMDDVGLDGAFQDDTAGGGGSASAKKTRSVAGVMGIRRSGRERNRDRHGSRARRGGVRRVSHFLTSSFTAPKTIADAVKATEAWMKLADMPAPGQIFEMKDAINRAWGFEPFYLSTAAVAGENMRRALLYGAKELLFEEKDISKRIKFIVCYVLSTGQEQARLERQIRVNGGDPSRVDVVMQSSASIYARRDYDALSIMSAHAAFLACKNGSTPGELAAAVDFPRVRAAMDRYLQHKDQNLTSFPLGFPLTKKDCAAVLVAHSLVSTPPKITDETLAAFEAAYGSEVRPGNRGGRTCHSAFLEIVGAGSMWSALERYAVATLAFDIDPTSAIVFGTGRAESIIVNFARSSVGREIGLSLGLDEIRGTRSRADSKASRMSSMRVSVAAKSKRGYGKRSSSVLSAGTTRVVRMLTQIGSSDSEDRE